MVHAAIAWSWLPWVFCLCGSQVTPCPIRGSLDGRQPPAESDGGATWKVPPYPQFFCLCGREKATCPVTVAA
uniref:Secreted protein n=1 Tax=Setaria viridis TaxID=4556 RepID=A0A4U6VE60_SETVI|nr:hypothetical protein SEVIR_3G270450v2 [Setaria viridis]